MDGAENQPRTEFAYGDEVIIRVVGSGVGYHGDYLYMNDRGIFALIGPEKTLTLVPWSQVDSMYHPDRTTRELLTIKYAEDALNGVCSCGCGAAVGSHE